MPQRFTYCLDKDKGPALLFESTNLEEVGAIADIEKIFQKGYSLELVNYQNPTRYDYKVGDYVTTEVTVDKAKCILVTESPMDFEPDKASFERRPTIFFYEGKKYSVQLRQRYNQCLSLFKAVGCRSCPDRGLVCLSEGAGFKPPDKFYDPLDDEALLEKIEKEFPKLGSFEFIHPYKTKTKNEFSSNIRKYWEHSFELVNQNAEELSRRAERAAESRAFKKAQCSKCVISDSCEAYRHCKGPYPELREILEQSCHDFYTALDRSAWPKWQLWEIGRNMGKVSKHSRWNIILAGLEYHGKAGIVPSVKRAKGHITEYKLTEYDAIAEVFGLAKSEETSVPPVTDPELIATLWLTLNSTRGAYQRYGWGCSRSICGVGISPASVTVQWTNGKYLHGVDELEKVADVARRLTYGRLGTIEKLTVR